jgi:hypothetical protein
MAGELRIAHGSAVRFSWRPRTIPDVPEAEYVEVYTAAVFGFAVLSRIVHPALEAGPVDPDPTVCPLGGKGVPFVRLIPIVDSR